MCSFRRATRRFSNSDNHSSNLDGVKHLRAGGTLKLLMIGVRVSQSVSAHRGCKGFCSREGGARVMGIGIWSEPVEGREAS